MGWKNWPYWLRRGLSSASIYLGLVILIGVLNKLSTLIGMNPFPTGITFLILSLFPFYLFGLYKIDFFIEHPSDVIISDLPNIYGHIASVILGVIILFILGVIIGKFKKKQ